MKINYLDRRNSVLVLLLFSFIFLCGAPVMADVDNSGGPVKLNLNGQQLPSDVDPIIVNGRTMVPVRVISESMGADVIWDEINHMVTVRGENQDGTGIEMLLKIGEKEVVLREGNSTLHPILDAAAEIKNDRTMVPLRFVCEALGLDVSWDEEGRIVYLYGSNYENSAAEISAKKIIYDNKKIDVNLQIPVISGLHDTAFLSDINNVFDIDALKFKNPIEEWADEFYQEAQDEDFNFWPYSAYTSYDIAYNKNNLLSITVDYYDYTGGAHGNTARVPYNYDVLMGEKLELDDMFVDNYDYISIINQEIKEQILLNPEPFFEDEIVSFESIFADQSFYIADDGIVIYFGLYEIAPYSSGIPEFKVPLVILEKGLKYQL